MKQTDPQFKLRLPEDLKARIEVAAEKNKRSMNAEIVACLEMALSGEGEEGAKLQHKIDLFMPFFAGLLESSVRLVERLPREQLSEPGPAMMVMLIKGLFDGAYNGAQILQVIDGLGPVLGIDRDRNVPDAAKAEELEALRTKLAATGNVARRIDMLEEATGNQVVSAKEVVPELPVPSKPVRKRSKKPD